MERGESEKKRIEGEWEGREWRNGRREIKRLKRLTKTGERGKKKFGVDKVIAGGHNYYVFMVVTFLRQWSERFEN